MEYFPNKRAVELLCEDANNERGWLSDGLHETATVDKDTGIVHVGEHGSIDLYAIVSLVEKASKTREEKSMVTDDIKLIDPIRRGHHGILRKEVVNHA